MKPENKPANGHGEPRSEFVEEVLDSLKKKAAGFTDKSLDELSGDLKSYVREHPLKSVLMAAGVGLVLGIFLNRNK